MKPFWILLLPILAGPAMAQQPLSPAEFEAYVTGKTLYFGENGQPHGVEQYLSDRRVRWSFLDGDCNNGRWYEDLDLICFVYDKAPDPQCWRFFLTDQGLRARFENTLDATTLYEVNEAREPMLCLGPKVGV